MLSSGLVVLFYGIMSLIAVALGWGWLQIDPLKWHTATSVATWHVAIGAVVGLVVVGLSQVLEAKAAWARRLTQEFRKIIQDPSASQILVIALCSSIGEEVFFRGFLQQALDLYVFSGAGEVWSGVCALVVSSVLFGCLHVGSPWRTFLPWTVMAVVMGCCFGGLFWWTGTLWAPIIAHFTINFLNLYMIKSSGADAPVE